jgi:hypothetical protein
MAALTPQGREKLTSDELLTAARLFGASYVVSAPRRLHQGLKEVYRNKAYAVYAVSPAAAGSDAAAPLALRRAKQVSDLTSP